jgi:hypothetical protein
MPPQCLTVLAPLREGADAALRNVLRAIGDDIKGRRDVPGVRPRIEFERSRAIHFARFAILDDPDRGPGRTRLLFASVYDGPLASHLTELAGITSDLDAIWSACEGYTTAAAFPAFIRAHALEPEAYYVAFREETVDRIRAAVGVEPQGASVRGGSSRSPARPFRDTLRGFMRAAPIVLDVVRAVTRFGVRNVLAGVNRIIASLDRRPLFRFLNRITRNEMPPRRSSYSSVALDHCAPYAPLVAGDEVPSALLSLPAGYREDVITQNQLTLVTVVAEGRSDRVRAVMSAIDSYARRLSPPGSLLGISTIHFVRWLLIDGGRRLVLVSDYDNSWENYIDEFAEMILSGLDAIWETSLGYPPDGARDLPSFKRFLRSHQVPAEVFFSAYPDQTVLTIAAATGRART